jgi:hypothetical protein
MCSPARRFRPSRSLVYLLRCGLPLALPKYLCEALRPRTPVVRSCEAALPLALPGTGYPLGDGYPGGSPPPDPLQEMPPQIECPLSCLSLYPSKRHGNGR